MNAALVIDTKELTKRYGAFEVVQSLNLAVEKGRITGFLGRNGAGKSTTIRMLLGITHPSSGAGTVLGRAIDDPKQSVEMRRHVAYVAEDKQLYSWATVSEMIAFTRSFYADWQTDTERALLRRYALPPDRKVNALSKGMRTKLALLLALSRRPELLILDEPSEGLDPVSIEDLLETLVAAGADGTTFSSPRTRSRKWKESLSGFVSSTGAAWPWIWRLTTSVRSVGALLLALLTSSRQSVFEFRG